MGMAVCPARNLSTERRFMIRGKCDVATKSSLERPGRATMFHES
jgi:hypothetical protein